MAFVCLRRSRKPFGGTCVSRASLGSRWGCGLRRPDPHVVGALTAGVVEDYRRYLAPFLSWLWYHELQPGEPWEFDDLLTEWRLGVDPHPLAVPSKPSKHQFEKCVAAIERVLTTYKGHLPLSRAALSGWHVMVRPQHTLALLPRWGRVVMYGLLLLDRPRVAAGLFFQFQRGLRPGEALSLEGRHLVLPEEVPSTDGAGILLLGVRRGTKSGRPQSVLVRDEETLAVMRAIRRIVLPTEKIMGVRDCGVFTGHIRSGAQRMQLEKPGWTSHSGRAGFATHWYLKEGPQVIPELCDVCRWASVRSMRVYLDVVGVTAAQRSQELEWKHGDLANWCDANTVPVLLKILAQIAPPGRN
jgi:integrase